MNLANLNLMVCSVLLLVCHTRVLFLLIFFLAFSLTHTHTLNFTTICQIFSATTTTICVLFAALRVRVRRAPSLIDTQTWLSWDIMGESFYWSAFSSALQLFPFFVQLLLDPQLIRSKNGRYNSLLHHLDHHRERYLVVAAAAAAAVGVE